MTAVDPVTEISSVTKEKKGKFYRNFINNMPLRMNGTFERIKLYTPWAGMKQEIDNYVKHCETC